MHALKINRLADIAPFHSILILMMAILCSCIHSSLMAQKKLDYTDREYESQIKTVRLYPDAGNLKDYLQSPATLLQQQNLLLEFDDLQENRNNYYVKLIHCNYDWTKSNLMDLDFLENFNENPITDYSYSLNTHIPYVHYRYVVPPVKLPGNYLLIVYRDEPTDIVLSKRILIYQNQLTLSIENQFAGSGTLQNGKQVFQFNVNYKNIEILNPLETVHVTIRQNQRWDNAKTNLPPYFIRDDVTQLEYRMLEPNQQFDGGSEFRFVDFRSLNSPGQNTAKLNRLIKPYELYVVVDGSRANEVYSQYLDLDGNYLTENFDAAEPALTGNYVYVNFMLKSPFLNGEDIFVVGAFNNYQQNPESKMSYSMDGYYESRQFLKQGLYNYRYEVKSDKPSTTSIEGNHFETENVYEVLIYYRPFRPNADLLLGYYLIPMNPR